MNEWLSIIKNFVPAMALASFAGFASIVSGEKSLTVRYILAGMSTSILTGIVLNACLLEFYGEHNVNVWVVTVSVGSFCSREIMDLFKKKILSKLSARMSDV